jgi:anti-sigma factor RsiW
MTTNTMSCEQFGERLMAYLEHETDDATRAALERHALGCAECGALVADLRKLRIDAANLPELQPSRDLWSGIAARIEAPVVPIGSRREVEERRPTVTRRWTRFGAMAAALVAAAGIGYFAAMGTRPPQVVVFDPTPRIGDTQQIAANDSVVPSSASQASESREPRAESREPRAESRQPRAAAPTAAPARPEVQLVVDKLTADYDREIARLRTLIEQRRNQLDPVTVAIIEKNLQVIDTAIVESKKAIARDPASRFLIESLNQSLQTKVELMRTAALLPSRT